MKKPTNYDSAESTSNNFSELQEGPLYVKIVTATDYPQKQYLVLELENKDGYGQQYFEQFQKWPNALTKYASYKDTAINFFKASITAIEKTNPGFVFNFDEHTLVGKYVYANLGYEEYMGDNGIAQALKCVELRSKEAYDAGRIKTPKLKKYVPKNNGYSNNAGYSQTQQRPQNIPSINVSEDDLPF